MIRRIGKAILIEFDELERAKSFYNAMKNQDKDDPIYALFLESDEER